MSETEPQTRDGYEIAILNSDREEVRRTTIPTDEWEHTDDGLTNTSLIEFASLRQCDDG